MRVYHTETQEDFNALMEELEREDCIWGNDNLLTKLKHKWMIWRKDTVIIVKKGALAILPKSCVTNDTLIVKYTKESKTNSKFPVVPQFVADWYEDNKENLDYKIWEYIYDWKYQEYESDFYDFMHDNSLKPIETLIKMKDGYEVEKEPLYYVHFLEGIGGYLNMRYDGLMRINGKDQDDEYKTQFTEAEIKSMKKGKGYWLLREPVEEVNK